jgi:membrane protein implicated in regulation of membrane protease activity
MLSGLEMTEPLIWIVIAVIFAVIEAFTMGLTTIWFTVGGVGACIIALLGGPLPLQITVFSHCIGHFALFHAAAGGKEAEDRS